MGSFNIYSASNIYVREMIPTVEGYLPVFKDTWELFDLYIESGRWKLKLNRNLEQIGTGHYTILKSLNYIRSNRDHVLMNDPQQRFKNIYFHFGLIIDCINQISRSIIISKTELEGNVYNEPRMSVDDIVQMAKSRYRRDYKRQYKNLVNHGISISFGFQPLKSYIEQLCQKKCNLSEYKAFKLDIQSYRNTFIHNPAVDIFYRTDLKKQMVVKKGKLKNYKFLNDIEDISPKDLIEPIKMVKTDYCNSLKMIDSTWVLLKKNIEEINTHPRINGYLLNR